MPAIRVDLPAPLRRLASIPGHEVTFDLATSVTLESVIRELEVRYPALRGAILDHHTQQRRPFLRFFALNEDISLLPLDALLPAAVSDGTEPLLIIAGIAGG
jgi:sulfur-carrier protein